MEQGRTGSDREGVQSTPGRGGIGGCSTADTPSPFLASIGLLGFTWTFTRYNWGPETQQGSKCLPPGKGINDPSSRGDLWDLKLPIRMQQMPVGKAALAHWCYDWAVNHIGLMLVL